MRRRNIHIQFWLSSKEAEAFDKKVRKSGLSRESYLRHLINGLVPQDAPPPDYYAMMRELRRIGVNLNQIAQRANAWGDIDAPKYDSVVQEYRKALMQITNAVLLPRPLEKKP